MNVWNDFQKAEGGTSSTVGGTSGFQVVYTDADDSVIKTLPGQASTGVNRNNANTTLIGTISGCYLMNVKASTDIKYSIDYLSSGSPAMQYNLHIRLEEM